MNDENRDSLELHRALHETDFSDESRVRDRLRQRLLTSHAQGAARRTGIKHEANANHRYRTYSELPEDYQKMKDTKKETRLLNLFALGFVALACLVFAGFIGVGVLLKNGSITPGAGNETNIPVPTVSPTVVMSSPEPTPSVASTVMPVEPTPAPTESAPADWVVYSNSEMLFRVSYPGPGDIAENNGSIWISLPIIEAGTNLAEKYMQIDVSHDTANCASPLTVGYEPGTLPSESVEIAGMTWTKQTGADAGAGNIYDFEAYAMTKADRCVVLTFVLHSLNALNFSTPPAEFNRDQEAAVFAEILATFQWLD